MPRHELHPFALFFGAIFCGLGVAYLVGEWTWVDISGDPIERKWRAIQRHVTQIAMDSGFMVFGEDGWKEHWAKEAYILRESTVDTAKPEDDLFAGLD